MECFALWEDLRILFLHISWFYSDAEMYSQLSLNQEFQQTRKSCFICTNSIYMYLIYNIDNMMSIKICKLNPLSIWVLKFIIAILGRKGHGLSLTLLTAFKSIYESLSWPYCQLFFQLKNKIYRPCWIISLARPSS